MTNKIYKHDNVRVRFAPSPTGYLHIGNLRTALFNWLFARHNDGVFLVRLEDTDRQRSQQKYTDSLFDILEWVGLTSDEPIVKQSDRFSEYAQLIDQLLAEGKAYRCYCSQQEIEDRQKAAGLDPAYSGYDGYCASRSEREDKSVPHVIRFKIPRTIEEITFDDLVRGAISVKTKELDDFVIARSDGTPTYNFVVVADDALMNISHVIRGEDHISNTPKQIFLYQAFGYTIPQFAHTPLILGPSGARLSKREAATSMIEYRKEGYLADALVNYLARLGWSHGDQEVFTRQELIDYFTLEQVGKKGAIFDKKKLDWLNGLYMRQTDNSTLLKNIIKYVDEEFTQSVEKWNEKQLVGLIDLYKQRTETLQGLVHELVSLYLSPEQYDNDAMAKWIGEESKEYLTLFIKQLEQQEDFDADALSAMTKSLCEGLSLKLVKLAQPIRIALTGKSASPGVFELLSILGKQESLKRLRNFVAIL